MEMASSAQEVGRHAASLLASLNRQRKQAQFCDCVLKHKENLARLYPAHKCILAGSSPVFASILLSTGALVELEDPCLSDPILDLLLDYIYSGTLPYTDDQQQYCSLLKAAGHLQMKELQEALQAAQHQTEIVNPEDLNTSGGAELCPRNSFGNSYRSYLKTLKNPSSCLVREDFTKCEERSKSPTIATTHDEVSESSFSLESNDKAGKTFMGETVVEHCCGKSTLKIKDSGTASESRQETFETRENWIQHNPESAYVSEINKEVLFQKQEIWLGNGEEKLLIPSGKKKRSLNQLCGAVPVIRHGSRAAVHQLMEESPVPSCDVSLRSPKSFSRSPVSRSVSTDNDNTIDCMSAALNDQCGEQNQDLKCNEEHDVFTTPVRRNQNEKINSKHNNKTEWLTDIVDIKGQSALCDSSQKDEDRRRDCLDSKNQLSSSFESPGLSKKERSLSWENVAPFPVDDSETGNESHCEKIETEMESNVENSNFRTSAGGIDLQDSLNGLDTHKTESTVGGPDKAPNYKAPSVTWIEMKKIQKRSKSDRESFAGTKRKTKVLHESVCADQNRPAAQRTERPEAGGVSEVKSEITCWPALCQPDFVQASTPSNLTVNIPSESTAKERSFHLSSPTQQPFQCSLCDRSFSQRGSLNRHVRSHLGVRPFPCPRCPMTFSRQYRVTEHMRVHQRCTVGNDFHKSIDSSINDNKLSHTEPS